MNDDVLVELRQRMPSLSNAERVVAAAILDRPAIVAESTITLLAASCGTSPATVARMCRACGFSGYKEFRIAVTAASGREMATRELFHVADAEITQEDSVSELITKVAFQEAQAIEETARTVDADAVDATARAIRDAPRIDIFGVGSSGLTAQDLQLKLHRIGFASFCWADAHLALTSAAITVPDALAIGISHAGTTQETNELLRLARERGARTVAITNAPGSPLASSADHVLTTSTREGGLRTGAMASRLAQLAIVDFIVVRLVQLDYSGADELLRATYRALNGHRIRRG